MTKKGKQETTKEICVIFVEGDADELMIRRLLDYYAEKGWKRKDEVFVHKTHGTPMFGKMKKGLVKIRQDMEGKARFKAVCCEFDTDVYVNGFQKEPDWESIRKELKRYFGVVEFCWLRAETSIENWMLDDAEGLIVALGLPKATKIKGATGLEKMGNLFRLNRMSYSRNKGMEKIKPIIDKLDIAKIREARKKELKEFEKLLGVTID